jgi:hypothetical protein
VRCGSRVVTARGLFAPPSLSQVTPQPATMAGSTNVWRGITSPGTWAKRLTNDLAPLRCAQRRFLDASPASSHGQA